MNSAGLETREARKDYAVSTSFDLAVIGGGIHGVCVGALAAKAGLSVVLLEAKDYAHATSSRSSKMAHGGLRYLEMFDFQQVFEGIKAREQLFDACPNLVAPEKFLIPIPRGHRWLKYKLGLGLYLYDLMVRNRDRRHRWIPRSRLAFAGFHSGRGDVEGCYQYTDGLLSDARLVFELLTAGNAHGMCALNYARVDSIQSRYNSGVTITWSDTLSSTSHVVSARIAINCAGPWAPDLQGRSPSKERVSVRYSRGSHLVFSTRWKDPSLFLPLPEKGRYYFVWPHPSGTMVGTTEREVSELDADPIPSKDEVEEILTRVEKDLPQSGLSRETLCYAFAGVRTLPVRGSRAGVSRLSRKHIWSFNDGVLTLLGGKYTTFAWTASEGLARALALIGKGDIHVPSVLSGLPSALCGNELDNLVRQLESQYGYRGEGVRRAVQRLGKQVLLYGTRPELWREIVPGVLELEVAHAIEVEHAETIEDILRRRLELEATPSFGIEALDVVKKHLKKKLSSATLANQEERWRTHLARIHALVSR